MSKTAVVKWGEEAADDFQVLKVDGVEAEQTLSFAGLRRLFVPVLNGP